jgi:triphosphoribosyl-dephospho-CoA synthase
MSLRVLPLQLLNEFNKPIISAKMLDTRQLEQAIFWACEQEVRAPKPGNVNSYSPGHNMQLEDFIKSARAIAPILSQAEPSVGQLILQSVKATRSVVHCNTNLGIILLFAPLCKAIHHCDDIEQLPIALNTVLSALDVNDAIDCFQAIRLAEAGGLGVSKQHDITTQPTISLLEAMDHAKNYDSIAKQYSNNFQNIFQSGLPHLTEAINYGETIEWASAFAYLRLLSLIPDTLVCRKYSLEYAQSVMEKASRILNKVNKNNTLSHFESDMKAWDKELKQKAINPGTTADMTAATLLIYAFKQKLS